jgi:hypothetical protein
MDAVSGMAAVSKTSGWGDMPSAADTDAVWITQTEASGVIHALFVVVAMPCLAGRSLPKRHRQPPGDKVARAMARL